MLNKLIRPPKLWSTHAPRRATWMELFFDLIFVAAIAQAGEPLVHHYTPDALVRYSFLLVLIWWAWNGHTLYVSRFHTGDAADHALTLVQTFLIAVMAANAKEGLDSESAAGFGAAYSGVRLILAGQYFRARKLPEGRALAIRSAWSITAAAALWLCSAFTDPPLRYAVWAIALAVDLASPWFASRHTLAVPPDPHHFPERFGLFTIILFGEFVSAVMRGIEGQEDWSAYAASSAIFGLAFAFVLRAWYFDVAKSPQPRPLQSHRDHVRFQAWNYAHLPLFVGIGVAGIGFRKLIDTNTAARLSAGESLLVCAAVALTMVSMVVIGGTKSHAIPQFTIASAVACFALFAPKFPLVIVAAVLLAACTLQTVIASRTRGVSAPHFQDVHHAVHGMVQ
jgi:low temperature requirement protein LtrA